LPAESLLIEPLETAVRLIPEALESRSRTFSANA